MGQNGVFFLAGIVLSLTSGCNQQNSTDQTALNSPQLYQCWKDTDCKGDRICERGVCTNPTAAATSTFDRVAPVPVLTPEPKGVDAVPQFRDYPSGPIYTGPAASLADKTDDFRTRNSAALAKNPVVFASEYVISTIGCGTSCAFQSFLSKRTGKQLKDSIGGDGRERIKAVRPDSLLVVTAGPSDTDENDRRFYAYFYVLKRGRLERILKKETTLPECRDSEGYCVAESPY